MKPTKTLLLMLLVILGILAAPAMAIAQGAANQILNQQADITDQFEDLYDLAFAPGASSDIVAAVRQASLILFVIFFMVYIVKLAFKLFQEPGNWKEIASFFAFLMFIAMLLGPVGETPPAMGLARGALKIKDQTIQSALRAQILNSSLAVTINQQINNAHQNALLRAQIKQCEAIPAVPVPLPAPTRPNGSNVQLTQQQSAYYDKLECYETINQSIQTLITQNGGASNNIALAQAGLQLNTALLNSASSAQLLKQWAAERGGNNVVSTIIWIANAFQYIFVLLLHSAYFLSILILPFVILTAVAPWVGMGGPIITWLAGFVGLIATEFFYMLIVSISSLIQANVTIGTGANSDLIFALILGVFGPIIAPALAKANVSGAIGAVSGGISQIAAVVPAVGGTAASFARFRS